MRIFAIDERDEGLFAKDWQSLGITEVCGCGDYECIRVFLNHHDLGGLIVVHNRCGQDLINELCNSIGESGTYVLVVTGGDSATIEQPCPKNVHVHVSKQRFSNRPDTLGHLRDRFLLLCKCLDAASTEEQVRSAWLEFDRSALSALIDLCAPLLLLDKVPGDLSESIGSSLMRFDDSWRRRAADSALSYKMNTLAEHLTNSSAEGVIQWLRSHPIEFRQLARGLL